MDLAKFNANPGAGPAALELAGEAFGRSVPSDYAAFLARHNGGEGFVGETYIVLWKADEIAELNDDFDVAKNAPGLIMFGTDGGEEGFAFDTRDANLPVVMVPFTGMSLALARPAGATFTDFMDRLAAGQTVVPRN